MVREEQVKELWRNSFDDQDSYVQLYFEHRYNSESGVELVEDGEVIAALQLIPYPMTYTGHKISVDYISGVCTRKDLRGKGKGTALMVRAFERMCRRQTVLATLIPANSRVREWYACMGFADLFYYTKAEVTDLSVHNNELHITMPDGYDKEVAVYVERKQLCDVCSIVHTPEDMRMVWADVVLSHGLVLKASIAGKVVGVLVAYLSVNEIRVEALYADRDEYERALLSFLCTGYPEYHIGYCRRPSEQSADILCKGMGRIIAALPLLKYYAQLYPQLEWYFYLQDDYVPQNNGCYHISGGGCVYEGIGYKDSYETIGIPQLTKLIFEPLLPFMNMMLD